MPISKLTTFREGTVYVILTDSLPSMLARYVIDPSSLGHYVTLDRAARFSARRGRKLEKLWLKNGTPDDGSYRFLTIAEAKAHDAEVLAKRYITPTLF